MEALELADSETKESLALTSTNKGRAAKGLPAVVTRSNPLMMGMDPPAYVLWVLRTVKVSDLEQVSSNEEHSVESIIKLFRSSEDRNS